ncbi:50S ribosomal protein L29 [Pseudobacteriovorax antillogorgiicola]|uniref:Large ribosomal subunit protein uL29 n=1 Tax=Pseudobacteriovorax antillogorgiicola TaxID=1513793 RepID=A0A1Y6B9M7_9BACT|nr:50S ribosomal protein L29 [Pseudobacteriovorax antillogorgiicola]TCS59370.1 LSU ribosomal protein L29P [Pseudobacteriovorax antillogorgiicola]SME88907.1 LSU ribosomal protein L29P [Pseudobacteriovorax antillogorgiicola]
MDVLKVTTEELRGAEAKDLRTAEEDVRKQLAELKMDIYSAAGNSVGTIRKLRKTLARIKTVQTEKARATNG